MVKMLILINSDSGDCVFSGDFGIYSIYCLWIFTCYTFRRHRCEAHGYFSESNNFCNVVFLVNLVNLVILMTLVIW